MISERDVAVQIASGALPSPTTFLNSGFIAIRVTGTGVAWRGSIGEFVYRDPAIWLSEEMCARATGVPIIAEHPPKGVLNWREFYGRIVGVTTYGFVKHDVRELWAIGRIIDQKAIEILSSGEFDTSPGVIFAPDADAAMLELSPDEKILVEGAPSLIDHVALVFTGDGAMGVWTKNGAADNGVKIENTENLEI